MKTLATTLLTALAFCFVSTISNAGYSPYPGFEQLSSSNARMQKFFEARKLAIKLLRDASVSASHHFKDDNKKNLANAAADKLLVSKVYFSSNPFNETCKDNSNAYVDPDIPDTIFICENLQNTLDFMSNKVQQEEVAQILVHESVHLLGSRNECTASRFEYSVMQATVGRATPDSYNEHGATCGLAEFKSMIEKYNTASVADPKGSRKKSGISNR